MGTDHLTGSVWSLSLPWGLEMGEVTSCISITQLKCNMSTFKARNEHMPLCKDLLQSMLMCSKFYGSQTEALKGLFSLFLYPKEGSAHVDGAMSEQPEIKALGIEVGSRRR